MSSIFDEVIERRNTYSLKWDYCKQIFGREDILPMWVADMDFRAPAAVTEAIIQRARHGIYGYTGKYERLSDAFTGWMQKRNNWSVDKSWIVYSPGVITSVNTAILAYTNIGEKILIQPPVYFPFFTCVTNNSRQLVTNPLINNNGYYEIDFADLESKLSDNVKMMILCSPHNPVGRVWKSAELEEIIRLCRKYNVILVSDEIHSDLIYKGYKHIPAGALQQENTITLMAPTKTFNLAGLSVSASIIPDKELRDRFANTLKRTGAGMLNTFSVFAAEAAYSQGEGWLEELILYLEGNLEFLIDYFNEYIPLIKAVKPEATYLTWLDCSALPVPAEKLNEFFTFEAGVGLNNGKLFGKEGNSFQRLNFACPRTVLAEGLDKIKKAVERCR